MELLAAAEKSDTSPPSAVRVELSPLEAEVIDLFVHLARVLGLPKSIAEMYGLLFISERPLPMDELVRRLAMSKGSASQGLKFLREIGAVRVIYAPGDRRDHFQAETELRQLLSGFLVKNLGPQFEEGRARLNRIEAHWRELPEQERAVLEQRVDKLRSWEKRGRQWAPLIAKLLR